MSKRKPFGLQDYLAWVIKHYQNLHQSAQDAYRIIHVEEIESQCLLTVQIVGKSITFKCQPEEIAADDLLLEKFSKKDVRTITYYACHEIKKPKRKIIWQQFSEKLNKMLFGIQRRGQEGVTPTTADEISKNTNFIKDLSQLDAHMVGFTTATEQLIQEKELIKKARETSD